MRVLIADDNRLMLEGFRRAVQVVEDIEIVGVTHTGAQMLPLVERRRPELVALELGTRGEGGSSCPELLSAHHPDVRVVVLSAASAHDDIRSALTSGARTFIVKSVNPLDIPSTLRHAHEGTVYHAIGLEPRPEDELRDAGPTERELTRLRVTPFASNATNGIGSARVAYPRGHAEPEAREREISALATGRR